MYKLSDETQKRISNTIGIPYETLIKMDDDEITAYIEQKNHKKIRYSKPRITGSGDDSVLLDKGKFSTMETVDERISKITKIHKSKHHKPNLNPITNEDENILTK